MKRVIDVHGLSKPLSTGVLVATSFCIYRSKMHTKWKTGVVQTGFRKCTGTIQPARNILSGAMVNDSLCIFKCLDQCVGLILCGRSRR